VAEKNKYLHSIKKNYCAQIMKVQDAAMMGAVVASATVLAHSVLKKKRRPPMEELGKAALIGAVAASVIATLTRRKTGTLSGGANPLPHNGRVAAFMEGCGHCEKVKSLPHYKNRKLDIQTTLVAGEKSSLRGFQALAAAGHQVEGYPTIFNMQNGKVAGKAVGSGWTNAEDPANALTQALNQ
jgi:hypothetical protein